MTDSRERAEGPPDLTDWKARAEQAERERDEAREGEAVYKQRYFEKAAESQQWAAKAGAAESALAEERRKARRLEGELTRVAESMGDTVALLTLARRLWGELDRLKVAYSTNLAQHVAGPDPALLAAAAERFSIRTCPVCGEEAHTGTCVDAALASGNAPEMNQERDRAIALRKLEGEMRCADCGDTWGSGKPGVCPDCGVEALLAPEGESDWTPCFACWLDAHELPSGERPAGPPEAVLTLDRSLEEK